MKKRRQVRRGSLWKSGGNQGRRGSLWESGRNQGSRGSLWESGGNQGESKPYQGHIAISGASQGRSGAARRPLALTGDVGCVAVYGSEQVLWRQAYLNAAQTRAYVDAALHKGADVHKNGTVLFAAQWGAAAAHISCQGAHILEGNHFRVFVARGGRKGLEVQLCTGRYAGHEHARFIPTGNQGFENALWLYCKLAGHGHGGKVIFIHRNLMQAVAYALFFQMADGIGLGDFGRHFFLWFWRRGSGVLLSRA